MCEHAPAPLLRCTRERETGKVRGCAVAVCALLCEWGRKAVSDTLVCSLLAPLWGCSTLASPGKSGGPLGTGQDRETEGGSTEARLSATMKRSGIKYKQNLLQYTVSLTWVGQLAERRSAGATVQWAQGGQERREDVVNLTGEWGQKKRERRETHPLLPAAHFTYLDILPLAFALTRRQKNGGCFTVTYMCWFKGWTSIPLSHFFFLLPGQAASVCVRATLQANVPTSPKSPSQSKVDLIMRKLRLGRIQLHRYSRMPFFLNVIIQYSSCWFCCFTSWRSEIEDDLKKNLE